MSTDAKESVAFAVSWTNSSDYLAIEKKISAPAEEGTRPISSKTTYASVVVSMILNGRSLLLMYVGMSAAILGPAAAAGSKDDDTSLHFPRT